MIKTTGKLWSIHSDVFGACIVARVLGSDGWVCFFCEPPNVQVSNPQNVVYCESLCLGVVGSNVADIGWRYRVDLDLKSNLITWVQEQRHERTNEPAAVEL